MVAPDDQAWRTDMDTHVSFMESKLSYCQVDGSEYKTVK